MSPGCLGRDWLPFGVATLRPEGKGHFWLFSSVVSSCSTEPLELASSNSWFLVSWFLSVPVPRAPCLFRPRELRLCSDEVFAPLFFFWGVASTLLGKEQETRFFFLPVSHFGSLVPL